MPQVPYNPVPAAASDIPTPRLNIPTNPDTFGVNVARATEHLGEKVAGAGDELFKRAVAMQDLINRAEADDAATQYSIKAGELHAQYSTLEGKDARDALPKYYQDLQKTRDDIRGGVTNPMVQKLYDTETRSVMARSMFNGAGHAATENKKWLTGVSQARVDNTFNDIFQNPKDQRLFESGVDQIREQTMQQGAMHGQDDETIKRNVTANVSTARAQQIIGLSRTDPFQAQALLEKFRPQLDARDADRVEKVVQSQTRTTGARNISAQLGAGDPDSGKSLEQLITEGKKAAEKLAPGDLLMPDFAAQRIATDYARTRAVKRETEQGNINTLSAAIMGKFSNGTLPTTVEELTASPQAKAAWEGLDERKQRAFLAGLTKNAKGDVVEDQARFDRKMELKGLAQSDPLKFLEANISDEDLPRTVKGQLIDQQIKIKGKAEGDPRVTHALGVLRPMLSAAQITPTADKDQYNRFVGSLQDAMDDFQKNNKKLPNAEEINLMGARLLQGQATPGALFGNLWPNKTPVFDLPVPEPVANRIKSDPFWADRGITPTDSDVQRIYAREQYNKLYGGKKSTAESGPKVPTK